MPDLLSSDVLIPLLVMFGYFLALILIGIFGRKKLKQSQDDYFLGSRKLGGLVLLMTMAATNFSAFSIYGFSGAAYRLGYSFYPIMAFGTAFMAITFLFIGKRVWALGKENNYITPPELMGKEMKSPKLRALVLLVMVVFSLPYIAIQPIAGGYTLEALFGIPYFAGASIVTGFIILYTFLGGFRTVVWTDVFQGIMMLTLMAVAVFGVSQAHGGFIGAHESIFTQMPELFSRPGPGGVYAPAFWFSYMILWFFCDPLFPQLFQRFFSAGDKKALDKTTILYPIATGIFFLLPIMLGVLGHLSFPGLEGKESDSLFPMLVDMHFSPLVGTLIITAGLAALMSTMDSQLLTLSSMFTKDIYEPITKKKAGRGVGRIFTVTLALLGLVIAYFNPSSILAITTETFTGLAVLFVPLMAILYWKRVTPAGAISSILVGESLVALYHFDFLSSGGFLSVIPILIATSLTLITVSWLDEPIKRSVPKFNKKALWWAIPLIAIFAASLDYWNWSKAPELWLGLPVWMWYFIALNGVLSLLFWRITKSNACA